MRMVEQEVGNRKRAEQEQGVEVPEAAQAPRIEEQREEHRREGEHDKGRIKEPAVVTAPSEIHGQRAAPDGGDPAGATDVDLGRRSAAVAEVDRPMRSRARSNPDSDRVFQRVQATVETRYRR